jgi:hypothetical protein
VVIAVGDRLFVGVRNHKSWHVPVPGRLAA